MSANAPKHLEPLGPTQTLPCYNTSFISQGLEGSSLPGGGIRIFVAGLHTHLAGERQKVEVYHIFSKFSADWLKNSDYEPIVGVLRHMENLSNL